jgi:hypothetical protein
VSVSARRKIPDEARRHLNVAASLQRHHPDDLERIDDAKRSARVLTLEDQIQRVVDSWPPLTPEQRDRLALLLRGSAG